MFSGKTEELIRRIKRSVIAKRKVQLFKPRIDARYDAEAVVSHSAQKLRSTVIDRAEEIFDKLALDTEVIGIDEVQFFGPNVVQVIEKLANNGVRVIVSGLDMDFRGIPFEPVPQLLAIAESILKVAAICVVCGEPATRSQRTIAAEDRVLVGATGQYEPRCRKCFSPDPSPATEPPEQALLPFV
ncbi:MAG: thymidine kinase [Deltaproteobacteria bacterium]|nr:thymidine kinase [Deltaproteobacteria bacterium]